MSPSEFSKTLQSSANTPITLLVTRQDADLTLEVTPQVAPNSAPNAPAKIGAELAPNATYTLSNGLDITTSLKKSYAAIYDQVVGTFTMIGSLFKEKTLSGIGGPVMIISQLFKTAQIGFRILLLFVCYVNVGLAVMNVLPLGALDGGQIAFTTIEFISQRKLSDTFKIVVNIVSLVLFGALFLYLTFKDVLALFGW